MPVYPTLSTLTGYYQNTTDISNTIHTFDSENVKMFLLTDIIDLGYIIYSIGDVLIFSFIPIIIYFSIKTVNLKHSSDC